MTLALDMTKDLAPQYMITVNVVGVKKWYVRMWIATRLFKLGAKIMNVGIKFEDKPWYGTDL